MEILIVGRGWTGYKMLSELRMRGHRVEIVSHFDAVLKIEDSARKPDWVVNCAGVTGSPNVDACEKDKAGTLRGNALFPIELYFSCEKRGIRLAHFSSGCIYEGTITDAYADPNFFGSIYSVSKGISDMYLKDKAVVFRIRMPFTDKNEPKNYLYKVLNYAKTGKLVDFGQNSLSNLDDAVFVACDVIEENGLNGPYNLVNKGSLNMHELADLMGLPLNTDGWYSPEEFATVAKAGRSTCTIPPHFKMPELTPSLVSCLQNMKMTK